MATEQLFKLLCIKDIERYPSHLTISGFKNIVSNKGFTKNSINTAIITLFNLDFDSKDALIP
jgi:hypothetical protein